ncbi:MAG: response regulator [Bacteroidales bacterium]|nr:response regulator [Bacteroidales bacterium]
MREVKFIRKHYERRVRWEALVIYILAIIICAFVIHYISNLKKSIINQRVTIDRNEMVLNFTNELIQNVNEAQSHAQLYTISGNPEHLIKFNENLQMTSSIKDSIIYYSDNDDKNKQILNDIVVLLNRKENIIKEITHQYDIFNPYDEINKILSNYKPKEKTTKIVAVTKQDTIYIKGDKKSFFQRVFSSEIPRDSVIFVTTTTYDTITEETPASKIDIMEGIKIYTDKGKQEYLARLKEIENQYQSFIKSDQEISEEISGLLITLHKQTLTSVMIAIQKSESVIQRNLNYSIYGGTFALVCIMLFILLIFKDIKRVSRARKAMEEAQKRTEEIMESRHKLLLSVSHDIKAPLSSVIGYIELMLMEQHNNEDIQRLKSMKYSSQHILSLLSNLLDFSSLEQGKQFIKRADFNVSELCDQLANMFKPIAENKQLKFFYHKNISDDLYINSDALKIKQVASNIISNALKYTIEGEVHFGVYLINNKLVFNVLDQGIGIPTEKIDELFKPFSKAENNTGLAEGNGFGLFVVKGLLELLGGNLKLMSELEKGSHFEISIPVKVVEKAETQGQNSTDNQIVTTKKKLNILLVDDDNSLLAVISAMLKKIGHSSDICRSYIEFNKYINELDKYDMILTDREMGTFSGNDVLKTIKAVNKDKKIILMTASDEYSEKFAITEGFDGYIKKPFSIKDLALLLNDNWVEDDCQKCEFNDDFPQLCTMFDNDSNAIRDILQTFVKTTSDNLVTLNDSITEHDFAKAQSVCHKMRPMFIQLEQKSADYLTEMDSRRGQDSSTMPDWEEKGIEFMYQSDALLTMLAEKYDISD